MRPARRLRASGSHLSQPGPASAFTAPRGVGSELPPTRARVRLLGPCFKTGRVGGRSSPQTPGARACARHTGCSLPRPLAGDGAGGGAGPPEGGTLPAAGRYRARPCGRSTFARGRPGPIRGRSRRSAAEGRRPGAGSRRDGGRRDDGPRGPPKAVAATDHPPPGLSPPGRLHGPHPFTSRRVHALLNSLFKVLFNFPSRYLSAIGPVPLFSLRWSLPPALGCIPKQPDSGRTAPGRAPPHLPG